MLQGQQCRLQGVKMVVERIVIRESHPAGACRRGIFPQIEQRRGQRRLVPHRHQPAG